MFVPAQLRGGKVKQIFVKTASLRQDLPIDEIRSIVGSKAKKQLELIDFLIANPNTQTAILNKQFGTALSQLDKKNLVDYSVEEKQRIPYALDTHNETAQKHILTNDQQRVVDTVMKYNKDSFLLFGVTGSGKTEVYMNVIERAVSSDKTAIMLVPEISLTPNMLRLFRARFGSKVAILHSGLSAGERLDEWYRLIRGQAVIAIGARSAVFAPLHNVGVIIIDEEHDSSYLSETNPRYDTLEVAQFRSKYNGCNLILGSATPSLTSYYKALNGQMRLLNLPNRINNRPLPTVEIVDMTAQVRAGNRDMFSTQLKSLLKVELDKGNQAIVYQQARFFLLVMCSKCVTLPNAATVTFLSYHRTTTPFKWHYCGKRYECSTVSSMQESLQDRAKSARNGSRLPQQTSKRESVANGLRHHSDQRGSRQNSQRFRRKKSANSCRNADDSQGTRFPLRDASRNSGRRSESVLFRLYVNRKDFSVDYASCRA